MVRAKANIRNSDKKKIKDIFNIFLEIAPYFGTHSCIIAVATVSDWKEKKSLSVIGERVHL